MGQVEIKLKRAPDDPKVHEPKFQEELREFSKSLHATGVASSQRGMAFDSVDTPGYPLPEFVLTVIPAVVGAVGAVCGAWVQARYGRKVRLKIGDVEAEGRTVDEINILLQQAADLRKIDQTKNDET